MNKQKHSKISCTIQKFPPDTCDDDWTKKRKIKWETQFEHVEVKNFCGNCQSFYLDLVRNDAKVPLFTSIEYGGNLVCWNFSCNLSEPCFFCSTCLSCEKKKQYRSKESDERLSLEWREKQMWSSNAYLHFERGTVGEINIAFNLMKQIFSFQVTIQRIF